MSDKKCGQCDVWHRIYGLPGFEVGNCGIGLFQTHHDQRCVHTRGTVATHGLLVYVSSPYTQGDVGANVHVQLEAAHRIMDAGHVPIWPLASHYLHMHRPRAYGDWMNADLLLVDKCAALLRLKGDSPGGDREVARAIKQGVTPLYGWDEFNVWTTLVNEANGDPTTVDRISIVEQITATALASKQ